MNHEELLLEQSNVLLHPVFRFKVELNGLYNKLCFSIQKSKKSIPVVLNELLCLIQKNWEHVDKLPYEELYMVLNVIKLARSQKNVKALRLAATNLFQQKNEEYSKLR